MQKVDLYTTNIIQLLTHDINSIYSLATRCGSDANLLYPLQGMLQLQVCVSLGKFR